MTRAELDLRAKARKWVRQKAADGSTKLEHEFVKQGLKLLVAYETEKQAANSIIALNEKIYRLERQIEELGGIVR